MRTILNVFGKLVAFHLGLLLLLIITLAAALVTMSAVGFTQWLFGVLDNVWGALIIYGVGVLTGAVLCGWRPPGYERWQRWQAERSSLRQERERDFKARQLIRDIHKQAEKYRKERLERGLPAKVTNAEWEEFLATRRLEYGPWGDDGQSCLLPQREEPNSTPQA
jgi:hypothetical protein